VRREPSRLRGDLGFTLIELLVVIVILGVLATVVVFSVRGITDRGEAAACASSAQTLRVASEAFRAKNGVYAATIQALVDDGLLHELPPNTSGNTITLDGGTITYNSDGSVSDNCATVAGGPGPGGGGPGDWFDDDWAFRKTLTIDSSLVSVNGNFPVLVSITDPDLAANALANGADILFTAANGTSLLPFQIESYAGGTLVAWVSVSVSASADAEIKMYYGNAGASSLASPTGVWTDYVAVYHMAQAPGGAGSVLDSTSNANHGTPTGTSLVAGFIGSGFDFNGTTGVVRVPDSPSTSIEGDSFTLSAWIFPTSQTADRGIISKAQEGSTNAERYHLGNNQNGGLSVRRRLDGSGGNSTTLSTVAGGVTTSQWNHVVATYDGAFLRGYIDGVEVGSLAATGNIESSTLELLIGKRYDNRFFAGVIDEARVTETARSAEWIATEFANQDSPGAFVSVGSVESN
jgi:prepilin-type N-terminal cleavage/methylation domain-containing protein